jgi:ketosteroid isomerase-like protein
MDVNIPEILAEVGATFEAYEAAFVANDIEALAGFFWQDPRVLRYGIADMQHGPDELAAFRAAFPPVDLPRDLDRTVITTFGRDFATAATLFRRASAPGKVGRQMQTWARFDDGWKVVAAHVSIVADQD